MKTYTSKEIVEAVIDAAESNFSSYAVSTTHKEKVEKRLNAFFDFLRGIHLEEGRRMEICDDIIGRARFVGEMIGSAYSYSTDTFNPWMSSISGVAIVHVFGYTIGRAVYDYIRRDIFILGMDYEEDSLAESFADELEKNRKAEEEKVE